MLGRFALPRAGWGRPTPRGRRPIRPLRQRPITRAESRTRPAGWPSRAWHRRTSGVGLRVLGALQEGTAHVFETIVPPCEAQELRPYRHHGLATFRTTGTAVVLGVERSGRQRAHQRDTPCDHDAGPGRWPCLPAPGGPHRKPSAGCWRVRQDVMGAGRCCSARPPLSWRTRQVLMAYQERPLSALHW